MQQFSWRPTSLLLTLVLILSGCADALLSERQQDLRSVSSAEAPTDGLLRHPQLLGQTSSVAGKNGVADRLFLGFQTLEANGVTRRILDDYGVTRRILQEYGVTRRVLESYGITRRVMESYGVTRRVLEEYGVTRRVLESYGITGDDLDRFDGHVTDALLAEFGTTADELEADGVTRRILEDYNKFADLRTSKNLSTAQFDALQADWQRTLKLKVRIQEARPGIFVSLGGLDMAVLLEELEGDPDIAFAEPVFELAGAPLARASESGPSELIPWGVEKSGALDVQKDVDPNTVEVFVLDSGVMPEDLYVSERRDFTMLFTDREEEYWDEDERVYMPYFDPGDKGDPNDYNGHGTHVAGTIGAEIGGGGVIGMAPKARIHSLKVLTDDGRTDVTTVVAAIDYAIAFKLGNPTKPTVMNLSLGMDSGSPAYNVLDEAVKRAVQTGLAVVVSAGNDGVDAATYSPAHVAEALTVGAVDSESRFASYSNFGAAVDLFAPGAMIPSLSNEQADVQSGIAVLESGTSMAAAHVTGAAVLILARDPQAAPADVKALLTSHSAPIVTGQPEGTAVRELDVAHAFSRRLPPFLKYAVATGNDLNVQTNLIARPGPGVLNASLYAGNAIDISGTMDVRGFGYYGAKFQGDAGGFVPAFNPSGLPGVLEADKISVPRFEPDVTSGIYNRVTGERLFLAGHVQLGTADNPVIWLVEGDLVIEGKTTFGGYGVFAVMGDVKFREDAILLDSDNGSVGFLARSKIRIQSSVEISGFLYSGGSLEVRGATTLRGSMLVLGTVNLRDAPLEVEYVPPHPSLIQPFWPIYDRDVTAPEVMEEPAAPWPDDSTESTPQDPVTTEPPAEDPVATGGTTDIPTEDAGTTGDATGTTTDPAGDVSTDVPAFLRYALVTSGSLEIKKQSTAESRDQAVNADVHSNTDLLFEDGSVRVLGHGTFGSKFDGAESSFSPVSSEPGQLPVARVASIDIPVFDAESYRGMATVPVHDGDLKLNGPVAFSDDPEAPTILFVEGRVKTEGAVHIDGYVVIVSRGTVEITHDLTTSGAVGIFSSDQIKTRQKNLTVQATLVAARRIELADLTTIVGSAVSADRIIVRTGGRIAYRPLPRAMSAPFWP